MYGIKDDRGLVLGGELADHFEWSTELPCQKWDACTFEGTILVEFDISHYGFTVFPPELTQLTNLRVLEYSGNTLNILPPEIGQLRNLRVLDCSDNELETPPIRTGQPRQPPTIGLFLQRIDGTSVRIGPADQH